VCFGNEFIFFYFEKNVLDYYNAGVVVVISKVVGLAPGMKLSTRDQNLRETDPLVFLKPLFYMAKLCYNTMTQLDQNHGDQIGRVSPNGQLFSLGSFWKITQSGQIVGNLSSTKLMLTKINLATFWAIFFTNSSGHPGQNSHLQLTF
jgi:hypothetical protein